MNETEALRAQLEEERKKSSKYEHLYEAEKFNNEHLHAALIDLRKKCEKWHNSTEMEEEKIVNKMIIKLDELKGLKDPISTLRPRSFDSTDEEEGVTVSRLQRKILLMKIEMEEKESIIELLQLQLKSMKLNHPVNGNPTDDIDVHLTPIKDFHLL